MLHLLGRTPHGVRGLKYRAWPGGAGRARRTPHGVRGLKFRLHYVLTSVQRRTPHGVRGLKCGELVDRDRQCGSHPSRGAWIEILS